MATVQLFATCLGDLVFPDAVADAEALLREAGFEVEFPRGQVCCGQPAFNSGHRSAPRAGSRARSPARSRATAPIVTPSGSCATMAVALPARAASAVSRSTSGSSPRSSTRRGSSPHGGTKAGGSPTTTRATCCASCASPTRRGGCSSAREPSSWRCRGPICAAGSAGTFSVRQPEVSVAMADDKLAGAASRSRGARQRRPGLPDAPPRSRRTRRERCRRPSGDGARAWNRRGGPVSGGARRHGEPRACRPGARQIVTDPRQIVTFRHRHVRVRAVSSSTRVEGGTPPSIWVGVRGRGPPGRWRGGSAMTELAQPPGGSARSRASSSPTRTRRARSTPRRPGSTAIGPRRGRRSTTSRSCASAPTTRGCA